MSIRRRVVDAFLMLAGLALAIHVYDAAARWLTSGDDRERAPRFDYAALNEELRA